MPWDASSIEEAKLGNWDETEKKRRWTEARLRSDRVQNERTIYNSHMGGKQEWLICTVRAVLSSLLQDQAQKLDDETLRTLFTEAKNVVNNRPLMICNYQIGMNQSLRTTRLHLKPKLYYHLLATFHVQIYSQESDGTKYITFQISFSVNGKESIACCNKNVRNETKPVLTVKLVMSSWSVTKLALETSGHLQTLRMIYVAMMVCFVKFVCLLLGAVKGPSTSLSWFIDQPKKKVQTGVRASSSGSLNWYHQFI